MTAHCFVFARERSAQRPTAGREHRKLPGTVHDHSKRILNADISDEIVDVKLGFQENREMQATENRRMRCRQTTARQQLETVQTGLTASAEILLKEDL